MRTLIALSVVLLSTCLIATAADNVLSPAEAKEGFVNLFDGKTLTGWTGALKGCHIDKGTIVSEHGNQCTEKEYANFVFRFDFKLVPAGNNGIGIRTPVSGDAAYQGMEIQILDDRHDAYKGIQPYQAHGSVYGVVAAKRDVLRPTGEWNHEEIVADGGHIKVTVNDKVVVDADISKVEKTLDGHNHPGLHNAKGHIALLGHTGPIPFKNLRIKELP